MKLNRETIRLIKNIGFLLILGIVVSVIIGYFAGDGDDTDKIADTPIRIESVRKIAELSTISYTDEIVVDSVEYFEELDDVSDWLDAIELSQRVLQRNIKRRLTLIVKGEIKLGFDLKKHPIRSQQKGDTLQVELPEAQIIGINMSPSGTEIYQEQGYWKDSERRILENKARSILIRNCERFNMKQKAKEIAERLIKRLLKEEKHVEITFAS
jgi:hypothetical protein